MEYFNSTNCDFSGEQQDWANQYVASWIAAQDDPTNPEHFKSACDAANDALNF